MKPLDQYPTPLTDEMILAATRNEDEDCDRAIRFACDLERKLALARDALREASNAGRDAINQALAATAPTP